MSEFVPQRDKPEWWNRARQLEFAGHLKGAEETIKNGVPNFSFAYEIADLYRQRMDRLTQAGDAAGAQEARKAAIDWIYFYASQATSGGEGVALSSERDRFLEEIGEWNPG